MTKTQNKKRKGFTIVELVIVIAVVAVLAGVMIPTFGGIIETANRSADIQLVAQINTILFVEEELGGGVNDAVEIQKIIKENGLKLETKSKGAYLWYDTEKGKVVLGGLNDDGIEIIYEGGTTVAFTTVDANRPVLLAEGDANQQPVIIDKGKFSASASSPEGFVNGYLFISTESTDGFARAIHGLRNAASDTDITNALSEITKVSGSVGAKLTNLMNMAAVVNANGDVILPSGGKTAAKIAILNSDLATVTATTLNALKDTSIYVVDLHSGVTNIVDAESNLSSVEDIYFIYNNADIEAIDKAPISGNIENLIIAGEKDGKVKSFTKLAYIKKGGESLKVDGTQTTIVNGVVKNLMPYKESPIAGTETTVYEFVGYSLHADGSNPMEVGTTEYQLSEHDKLLFNDSDAVLYAVYVGRTPDVMVKTIRRVSSFLGQTKYTYDQTYYYASGALTGMLSDSAKTLPQGTKGAVISILKPDVKLDATLLGLDEATLTIPSNVTLHLPYNDGSFSSDTNAKHAGIAGIAATINTEGKGSTYDAKFDKLASNLGDTDTKLTILDGVTLENKGTIYVDAKIFVETGGNPEVGFADENNCAVLQLENGSKINTTGTIYAYGVIRGVDDNGTPVNGSGEEGEGLIIVNAGTVTEMFTILDFHGGTDASNCVDKNISPFNNWQVDNIRANMTINEGAKYKAQGAVHAGVLAGFDFVMVSDKTDDSPLFVMTETGTQLQKTYGDGFELAILKGAAVDCHKTLTIAVYTADFAKMPLPIADFDIIIHEGATLTLSNNLYKVLPGSNVTVNGTLNIETNIAGYESFDRKTDTDAYTAVPYPTDRGAAQLVVNGTLNFADGSAFAGKIIPGSSSATINVDGSVDGISFSEGYHNGSAWVTTTVEGQPTTAVINGKAQGLVKGEYKTTGALGKYSWIIPTTN